jgi:hypothetical protein
MVKVCSKGWCKRLVKKDKFKTCKQCRDQSNKYKLIRRERAAKATARDGYKYCNQCSNEYPLFHFKSSVARRKKLTTWCANCRAIQSKTHGNKSTKVGQCRQVWLDWRNNQSCERCEYKGPCIEADHISKKKRKCSDYHWWAINGGPEALKSELSASVVRPLCRFCHRIKTQQERGLLKKKNTLKKRAYVNAIKLKKGKCSICNRKLEKQEDCCAYDFDHFDTNTKLDNICKMISSYSFKKFYECVDDEISKCRLVCANCHLSHTNEQKREKKIQLIALLESKEDNC